MRFKNYSAFALSALLLLAPVPGAAYHFFYLQSGSTYVPVKWTNFPVDFKIDSGPTSISAEMAAARTAWNSITTAKDVIGNLSAAGVDYTAANFGTAWGKAGDGQQEVVLDEDGSIISLLGGKPGMINGFGMTYKRVAGGRGEIYDAFLLLNGSRTNFDRQSTEVHEMGHIQGLAHSSVGMYNSASFGGEFGLASAPGSDVLDPVNIASVPTMHPFSNNTGTTRQTPKADDIAGLSELYPEATFTTSLGSIGGTVTRCSDGSAVTGVNVRVVSTSNPNIQLSRFSGYDGNTTGTYLVNGVPPGSYRVLIEGMGANNYTIDRFTGSTDGSMPFVPAKFENDFPSQYQTNTCGGDLPGTATPVTANAASSTGASFRTSSVDLAFVVDNTGSMYNEIAGVRTALSNFISTTKASTMASGKPFPTIALIPFVDTPWVQLISNDPAKLQAAIALQSASGGGDCPEPSNNALLTAGRLLRKKGVAILYTDADSDANGPGPADVDSYYTSKGLRLSVLLSGSCSGVASFDRTGEMPRALTTGGSSANEEYTAPAPQGALSSIASFSDETKSSGGIFNYNTAIKSGSPTGYINTATNVAVSSVIPAIGLVTPVSGPRGATINVTLTGANTNFTGASVVTFSGTGIVVNSTSTLSATSIVANITIDPAATAAFRDVTVTTNLGGGTMESATGAGSFEVTTAPSTPTVTGTAPSSGGEGSTLDVIVSGIGTHFVAGTSTARFGTGVTVNSLTVLGPTSAKANITIDPAATVGFRYVSITTGSETASDTGTGSFLVTAPSTPIAVISALAPRSGNQGQTVTGLVITGQNTHFVQGVSTLIFSTAGITVTNLTVNSATSATANLSITGTAALGFSDVQMVTSGETASILAGFQIQATGGPGSVTVTNGSLPSGVSGSAYPTVFMSATGGSAPYGWSATGLPPGLTITGTGTIQGTPTSAGVYSVTVSATDSTSSTGSKSYSLVIFGSGALRGQTITFAAIPNHVSTDLPFTLSASATSGLPVTFSVINGPATLAGNVLTLTGLGTVTVQATQAGSSLFAPAATTQSFDVTLGSPTISAVVNAGSQKPGPLAPGSSVEINGNNLASGSALGDGLTTQKMSGATVAISTSDGRSFTANLSWVSFSMVSFVLPAELTPGPATLTFTNATGASATAPIMVVAVGPALYSADSSGAGVASATVSFVAPDGSTTSTPVYACLFSCALFRFN